MMRLHSPQEIQSWRKTLPVGTRVGFVATMGALHGGHAKLIERARSETDVVVVSIFVNPTQFNNPEDLAKYPRTPEADSILAKNAGADLIWTPEFEQLYPDGYRYKVTETQISTQFEGAFRPGHFDGVLAVVMKLLNTVAPTKAYFGEKDFQQLTLIQQMVAAFFMPVEIVPVPTMREADGLAMSSRNLRLSPDERQLAPQIFKVLNSAKNTAEAAAALNAKGFRVEYVDEWQNRRLIAAWLGNVRLIDNVPL